MPPPPDDPFAAYRVSDVLGKGSMAQVNVAVHIKTGTKVALKIISRKRIEEQCKALQAQASQGVQSTAIEAATRGANSTLPCNTVAAKIALEVRVLSLLKHPHIIRLYDVIFTPTDVVLVLEYAAGGELFDYLNSFGRFAENQARTLFQQLISALEYCHANRVAHRDLKPENLLLDTGYWSIKLTDFDLAARIVDGQLFDVSCGTPNYAAPEVIAGQLYSGPEADTWSAGVVLYAMLVGSLPFDDEHIQNLFRKIREGVFKMPNWISPPARDLLRRMLVVDPLQRATIQQIMAHPWVRGSIPRYIVDIHEACVQQACGIGVHDMVSRSGPYWDGYQDHGRVQKSDEEQQLQTMDPAVRRRRFTQAMGSVDDFGALHLVSGSETSHSIFPPPPSMRSDLDHEVVTAVAAQWGSTFESTEASIHRAMQVREYEQTMRLHELVHGRPPLHKPPAPPASSLSTLVKDHDVLVTYVMLRHKKRSEASTLHRDPAHSVSLGADLVASLREGRAASSWNRAYSASHAVDLQDRSVASNVFGQGSLGGALRNVRVGVRPVAPAPGESVTSVFSGGLAAVHFDGLRALDPASTVKEERDTDSSGGSSQSKTRTATVRQPPPLPEPIAIKLSAVPHYVYNGVTRRPGMVQIQSPSPESTATPSTTAPPPPPLAGADSDPTPSSPPMSKVSPAQRNPPSTQQQIASLPSVDLPLTAATREQEEQMARLGRLLDKPPQFTDYGGAATAEVWAQTFRLGVMSDDSSAPSVFTRIFDVLKTQGYVWKVIRPYYICALCHVTQTKFFVTLVKCAVSVTDKFIVDFRLAPCSETVSALYRLCDTLEALATAVSGPAGIARRPAGLRPLLDAHHNVDKEKHCHYDPTEA